jgi:alpha-beta hydrolase superfamily lysophospholipase
LSVASAAKAHKRAMPIERLVGNGMSDSDARELHRRIDDGVTWHAAADRLGDRNLARARDALDRHQRRSARESFFFASACYRFGQVPLADGDRRKRPLYRRMLDAFRSAGRLAEPPHERIDVPWRGGLLSGWLIPGSAPGPVVLQLCGISGSREEYEAGSRYLTARGLGAALVDAPGQGETRLLGGLHFDEHAIDAVRALVDAVLAHPACDGRIGLWGNSAGGWIAVLAAAADPRVTACCATGGTDRPTEILDRYPRFVAELQRMTGHDDPDASRAVFDRLAIDADVLREVRCPLHVVHGTPDRIFRVDGARRIHAGAHSTDKTLTEFPDGDHCVTNRSHEKHTLVAAWFAERLTRLR